VAHISNIVIPTGASARAEGPFVSAALVLRLHDDEQLAESTVHGITSRPRQRVWEHKTGAIDGFSERYHTTRLVYLEPHRYVATAIGREKQIKRWRREKKLALRESMNPQYRDLAADWFGPLAP
jgi:putative endonuclease